MSKGFLHLANRPAHTAWSFTLYKECIPGCSVPEIWMRAKGPSPTLYRHRHNALRDITASLMTEACHCVAVEPTLHTLSGEQMALSSAITIDDTRVDIQATDFWGDQKQRAFFDVKVFNPFAKSYLDIPLPKCYKRCEHQKKRA